MDEEKGTKDVDSVQPFEIFCFEILDCGVARYACIVDYDVDLEFGLRLGGEKVAGGGDEEWGTSGGPDVCLYWETGNLVVGFNFLGQGAGLRCGAV